MKRAGSFDERPAPTRQNYSVSVVNSGLNPQTAPPRLALGARLGSLPDEIIANILKNLNMPSFLKFGRTGKSALNFTDVLHQDLRTSHPEYKSRPVYGPSLSKELNLEKVLKFYYKDHKDIEDTLWNLPLSSLQAFTNVGIPGAASHYNCLFVESEMLFPDCVESICQTRGWKNLRILVNRKKDCNRFLNQYANTARSADRSVELVFNGNMKLEYNSIGHHGMEIPIDALTLNSSETLLIFSGKLSSVKKLAIYDTFFVEETNEEMVFPESVKERLPNLIELSIETYHDDNLTFKLLDLMPQIQTLVVGCPEGGGYVEGSLKCIVRSGIVNLHICKQKLLPDDFREIAESPNAGNLRTLHLADCKIPTFQCLPQLLESLPALQELSVNRTRILDTDPSIWRAALWELASKRNLRLEMPEEIPLLSSE